MVITLLKFILTPLLVAFTTLASRRWGPTVGGWLVGLPITSGPVSVFLLIEQGNDFAVASAHSTLNGVISVVAFSLTYERVSRKFKWPLATFAGLAGYFAVIALFSQAYLPLYASSALALGAITLGYRAVPPTIDAVNTLVAPAWDLPFRMIAATIIVVAITTVSGFLGPQISGLLSTFPASICVMSAFSHYLHGTLAVRKFEQGVIVGSYAFAVFFIVAVPALQAWHPVAAYLAASCCALATNVVVFRVISMEAQARQNEKTSQMK